MINDNDDTGVNDAITAATGGAELGGGDGPYNGDD